VVSPT